MPLANDVMLQLVSHECPKDPERIRLYLEKLRQSAEENAKKSNMKSVVYYRTGEPLPLYKIAMKHNISKLLSTGQKVDYEKMNRQSDLLMTNHASWPDWLKTEITSHMRDMTTEESHTDATKKGVIFSMFIAPGVEKYFSDDADNSVAPFNKAKLLRKLSAITSTSIDEYTQEKEATLEKEQTPLSVRKVDSDHKKFRLTVAEIISPISNNHEFEEKSKGDKGTPKQSIKDSISSLVNILPNIDNDILLEITLEKLEDSNKTIQEKLISIGGSKDGKKILNDLADKVSEISQPWKQNPKYEKKWKITQWFIDKINGARQALGYTSSQEKVGLKLGASVSKAQSEVAKQMKQQTKDHQDPPSTDSSSLNPK